MNGQGEMVNTSANNVDTRAEDQPIVIPEQGQEMIEHTWQPQPLAPTPQLQTPEPHPHPWTPVTDPLSGLQDLGHVTEQKPRPAVPIFQEAEADRHSSCVDVNQQLVGESAGGDSLPDIPLPDVPFDDVPLPDEPLLMTHPAGLVGEKVMVVAFRLGSGSGLLHCV